MVGLLPAIERALDECLAFDRAAPLEIKRMEGSIPFKSRWKAGAVSFGMALVTAV